MRAASQVCPKPDVVILGAFLFKELAHSLPDDNRSEPMSQCLLLPDRRTHTLQKVRIGSHRVLYLTVHDDPHPAEVFSWSKVRRHQRNGGAVRRHCPPAERVPSVRVFPLSLVTGTKFAPYGVIDVLDSWIAQDPGR